jgi:ectoine hydroxylase-related dioxygenase (phytanoyl-CoA dioxygenase family)
MRDTGSWRIPLTTFRPRINIVFMTSPGSQPAADHLSTVGEWESRGYIRVDGFLTNDDCRKLIRAARNVIKGPDAIVRYESNLSADLPTEKRVSKLYRFHRGEPFRSLATDPRLIALLRPLIGGEFDIFLSQIVWKVPCALGQPWHQDSSIFPFQPSRPVVAAWIALTAATEANSCLRFVPGSHTANIAPHDRDQSGPTAGRYVTLVDQDVVDFESIPMSAGDLAVFDSHLIHSSGDNMSDESRIALCFHFAATGTLDRTAKVFGQSHYNDWMPAWRASS